MNRAAGILVAGLLVAGCTGASTPSPAGPTALPSAQATVAPSRSTPPATSPTPSRAPVSSPEPSRSATGSGLRLELVATFERTELYAAAAFGGGFVVGGCWLGRTGASDAGCTEARILRSTDGRTWTDAVISGAADRRIIGIAATPLGLLAFGADQPFEPPATRSVWRSTDGARWEPFAVPAPQAIVFTQALVLGNRTVLVGADTSYDFAVETEAWATTDGRHWSNGTTPMGAKVATDAGILAFGDGCVDLCPPRPQNPPNVPFIMHRSADGFVWTEDARDPALAGTRATALAAWAGRAVVGGAIGDGASLEASVWFEEPGAWRAVRLDGGRGYAVTTLMEGGGRLIAGAETDDGLSRRAWWTADGRTWESGRLGGIDDGYPVAWAGDPLVVVVDYRSIWLSDS